MVVENDVYLKVAVNQQWEDQKIAPVMVVGDAVL